MQVLRLLKDATKVTSTEGIGFRHPPKLSRSNRELRNSGKVLLVDVPLDLPAATLMYVSDRVVQVINAAKRISNHVVVVSQPVAYDEGQLPGVAAKWFSLYPVEEDRPVYMSNLSVAESIRARSAIALAKASTEGAIIIDLDGKIRPLLSKRDDLFIDKWHFSAAGAVVAAEIIAVAIKPLIGATTR